MKNKFVALSTLVPMAFAISSFEAFSDPETERNQAFTKLGTLIENAEELGQQTSNSSKEALEQFKNLQSMFKDAVSKSNAIQADLNSKNKQLKKTADELEQTKKLHQSERIKSSELALQLKKTNEENERKRRETQSNYDKKLSKKDEELKAARLAHENTQSELKATQSKLKETSDAHASAQAALDAKIRENEQSQKDLEAERNAHEQTRNAHANTLREKVKAEANAKAKDIQLQNIKQARDMAEIKKKEQEDQLKKLERKRSADKEEQKRREEAMNALRQEMTNMRTKIGDALGIVDSNVESIKEEVKKIESSAGVSNAVKESCVNISVILENIDESLAEEKKDLLQLRKDAAELEAKKAQDEANANMEAEFGD